MGRYLCAERDWIHGPECSVKIVGGTRVWSGSGGLGARVVAADQTCGQLIDLG
jgi:hypothetical protein